MRTWYRQLGHSPFKTVVELAQNGASRTVITDLPVEIPGLDACTACVVGKSVHLPHMESCRAREYLERVHIYMASPVLVVPARGRGYAYVVVDDYTRAIGKAGAFSNVRLQ